MTTQEQALCKCGHPKDRHTPYQRDIGGSLWQRCHECNCAAYAPAPPVFNTEAER